MTILTIRDLCGNETTEQLELADISGILGHPADDADAAWEAKVRQMQVDQDADDARRNDAAAGLHATVGGSTYAVRPCPACPSGFEVYAVGRDFVIFFPDWSDALQACADLNAAA